MLSAHVGYRFAPTPQESINYYLKNKNLGKTSLVNDAISEINICSVDPKCLPPLAKINSGDLVWHFFSPIVYTNSKEMKMKRSTGTGFWKSTGPKQIIKDKSGSEIGFRRTVYYHEGTVTHNVRSPWSMKEYHITCLPHDKTTHVLCQVKYKGADGHILYGASGSMVSHSDTTTEINTVPEVQVDQPVQDGVSLNDLSYPLNVQENLREMDALNPNMSYNYINRNLLQQIRELQVEQPHQYPLVDAFDPNTDFLMDELLSPMNVQDHYLPPPDEVYDPDTVFNYADSENYGGNELFGYNGGNNEEFIMQENCNVYVPRKALSGIIVDCSSDSDSDGDDAESISATSYNQGTSSPHDSVCSLNEHFSRGSSIDSYKDLQTSGALSANRKSPEPSKQEMKRDTLIDKKTSILKTKDLVNQEEIMERNHKPQYIYLMNMMVGFIILVGFIGNIKY